MHPACVVYQTRRESAAQPKLVAAPELDRRVALEVELALVDELDALDEAVAALEVDSARLAAGWDLRAHLDVVRRAVGIDHLEIHDMHGIALDPQLDLAEVAFLHANLDHV